LSEPLPEDRGFGLIQPAAERMKRCTGRPHKSGIIGRSRVFRQGEL
jgi:hypothetical protein